MQGRTKNIPTNQRTTEIDANEFSGEKSVLSTFLGLYFDVQSGCLVICYDELG